MVPHSWKIGDVVSVRGGSPLTGTVTATTTFSVIIDDRVFVPQSLVDGRIEVLTNKDVGR